MIGHHETGRWSWSSIRLRTADPVSCTGALDHRQVLGEARLPVSLPAHLNCPELAGQNAADVSPKYGKDVCRLQSDGRFEIPSFDILSMPEVAANHLWVVSYRNSFDTAATSRAKSRASTRSLKYSSIKHLRSEITAATRLGLSLFFRLSTRNQRSTLKALPVYMEVRLA